VTAWKVHPVVIVVADVQAARELVASGAMRCPDAACPGTLRAWSRARARTVTLRGGLRVRLRPYRVCCRACTVTHVLLPAGCLLRRAYDVETVGTALLSAAAGAGTRRVAATVGAPRSTVRAWLRAIRDEASSLTATAVAWTLDLGGDPADGGLPLVPAPDPIAAVLAALGAAAATVAAGPAQVTPRPGPVTGVDYLTLMHEQFQQQVWQRLHQGRPHLVAAALPWQQVNVLTGGRLLASGG
jgi:transposase-like protein